LIDSQGFIAFTYASLAHEIFCFSGHTLTMLAHVICAYSIEHRYNIWDRYNLPDMAIVLVHNPSILFTDHYHPKWYFLCSSRIAHHDMFSSRFGPVLVNMSTRGDTTVTISEIDHFHPFSGISAIKTYDLRRIDWLWRSASIDYGVESRWRHCFVASTSHAGERPRIATHHLSGTWRFDVFWRLI
jgi:hypothetical protein